MPLRGGVSAGGGGPTHPVGRLDRKAEGRRPCEGAMAERNDISGLLAFIGREGDWRECVQVLRLLETFGMEDLYAAVRKAL